MNRKGEKKNPSMRGLQSTDVRISTTYKSSHSSKLHDRVLKNTFWNSKYHVKGSCFLSIAIKYHNSLKRTSVNKKKWIFEVQTTLLNLFWLKQNYSHCLTIFIIWNTRTSTETITLNMVDTRTSTIPDTNFSLKINENDS